MILRLTISTTARFVTTAVDLVDSRPGASFGFFFRHTSALVTFFYVLSLPLLFFRVFGFVSAWHRFLLWNLQNVQMVYRGSQYFPVSGGTLSRTVAIS